MYILETIRRSANHGHLEVCGDLPYATAEQAAAAAVKLRRSGRIVRVYHVQGAIMAEIGRAEPEDQKPVTPRMPAAPSDPRATGPGKRPAGRSLTRRLPAAS